jgi:hypothetical protein
VLCSIWQDADFCALAGREQRMFLLLLSQPDLSLCGVIPYRPKRWARLSADATVESVEKGIRGLSERSYVVVDDETDELWVRTFLKYDGIFSQPKLRKGFENAVEQVMSIDIRSSIRLSIPSSMGTSIGSSMPLTVGEGTGVGEGIGTRACGKPDCVSCQGSGWRYHATAGREGPCECTKPPAGLKAV